MYETKTIQEVEHALQSDGKVGLSKQEAQQRLVKQGENRLDKGREKKMGEMILEQLNEPMIFILFIAAAVSMLLREFSDTSIILVVIVLNTTVGVIQEGKAIHAMEALEKLAAPMALVKREGEYEEIPAAQVVVGDLVKLEAGRQTPADMRLLRVRGLWMNESTLTGESLPVEKQEETLPIEVTLAERKNMLYMSTEAMKGQGEGLVVATGMQTELGQIAGIINESKAVVTPLSKRLGDLGNLLSIVAVALCVGLFAIGVIQHRNILQMLLLAISLAVAAIPEGLPAVVTIVLALGVARMAKEDSIIRKLPAVETLGSVGVVCSDKTGTLTQNKMSVVMTYSDGELCPVEKLDYEKQRILVDGFLLCNDAVLGEQEMGDPTELALLHMGKRCGVKKEILERQKPRIGEIPFDSNKKYMTTIHKEGSHSLTYTKGACDYILHHCRSFLYQGEIISLTAIEKMKIQAAMEDMAQAALRVLALAQGTTFIGMAGMMDPPRQGVKESVFLLKEAGVKVAMITGDHKDTAFAIAHKIGIAASPKQCLSGEELETMTDENLSQKIPQLCVFARVTPVHKVRIVKAFQENGQIVAMTGDGVNDAPSLKAADIGIAMGKTGTDVAKNAADMILTDDNFSTIEKAMEEGRSIYANIRKSILFLLSSNFGEIITMFAAVLFALPSPLKASHILWVNLITDSLPALALGIDKNNRSSLMKAAPREAKESLFAHGGWFLTIFYGFAIGGITLYAFLKGGQTCAFTVLGISELFHAIGMRDCDCSVFHMKHRENPLMIAAFGIGIGLQVMVTEVPYLIEVFQTTKLSLSTWIWLLALASVPLLLHELRILVLQVIGTKPAKKIRDITQKSFL